MFTRARSFNRSLNNWNVSKVETMFAMFDDATSLNQPLHAPKGGAAAAPFTAPPKPDGRRWAPGHRERVIHAHQDEGAGAEGGGGKTRAGGGPLLERKGEGEEDDRRRRH